MGSKRSCAPRKVQAWNHARTLGTLCAALLSCGEPSPSQPPAPPPENKIQALLKGCEAVPETAQGPLCILGAGRRNLVWAEGLACEAVLLQEDGQPIKYEAQFVGGGCRLRLSEPGTKQRSTLTLIRRQTGAVLWSFNIDRSRPDFMSRTKLMWRRADVDLQEPAATLLASAPGENTPEVQLDISNAEAVRLFRLGDIDGAISKLGEVIARATSAGYPDIAFDAAQLRISLLLMAGLPDEAALILQEIKPLTQRGIAWPQLGWEQQAGQISLALEDFSEAEKWLRKALADAERTDSRIVLRDVKPVLAHVLILLDRTEEGRTLTLEAASLLEGLDDCGKTELLVRLSLNALTLREAGNTDPTSGGADTLDAGELGRNALVTSQKCAKKSTLANIYAGLAHVAVLDGRLGDAMTEIGRARATSSLAHDDQMRLFDLEARIALLSDQPDEALQLSKKLGALSAQYPSNWRNLYQCKASISSLAALKQLGSEDRGIMEQAQACMRPGSKLAPAERRILIQRAAAAGLSL